MCLACANPCCLIPKSRHCNKQSEMIRNGTNAEMPRSSASKANHRGPSPCSASGILFSTPWDSARSGFIGDLRERSISANLTPGCNAPPRGSTNKDSQDAVLGSANMSSPLPPPAAVICSTSIFFSWGASHSFLFSAVVSFMLSIATSSNEPSVATTLNIHDPAIPRKQIIRPWGGGTDTRTQRTIRTPYKCCD